MANALNNALIVYCATLAVSWLIAVLLFSNKLFKCFHFHLTPLHSDVCAGLGQIENALGISALLIANLGIAALVMNGAFLTGKFTPFSLGEAIVAAIKEDTDKLAELKRRYDLLQDTFPLWPTQHFVRHIATLGIPAVITFIGGIPAIYRSVAPFVIQLFAHK